MKQFTIQTFGCQMNYSDSERITGLLEQAGWKHTENEKEANMIIFNTCSVRQKSEDKAVGAMKKTKEENPNTIIAVTGCMIRKTGSKKTSNDRILQIKPVDLVFRIEDLGKLPKIMEEFFPGEVNYADEIQNYFSITPKVKNTTQVYVPIMQGCDKFCAYCIVPHTRGREISRPMPEILKECEKLVRNGALEITLLGQNVNSYAHHGQKSFAQLLHKIDQLHLLGLRRTRFTSPHPQDFKDDVIHELATMKTACPYVHLPAQHGSDHVLREMKRNYTVAEFETIIHKLKDRIPNCAIATDIIVGFPGETEDDMLQLLEFGDRMQFDFSYTAIYSPRRGTTAADRKDQIPAEEKKSRFHRFDEVVKHHALAHRAKYIGRTLEILIENSTRIDRDTWRCGGRSPEMYETYFNSQAVKPKKERLDCLPRAIIDFLISSS